MAKQRPIFAVTVHLATGGEVHYSTGTYADDGWCTEIDVSKGGELRLLEGWRQRVFHPPGEWTGYTVTRLPVRTVPALVTTRPNPTRRGRA